MTIDTPETQRYTEPRYPRPPGPLPELPSIPPCFCTAEGYTHTCLHDGWRHRDDGGGGGGGKRRETEAMTVPNSTTLLSRRTHHTCSRVERISAGRGKEPASEYKTAAKINKKRREDMHIAPWIERVFSCAGCDVHTYTQTVPEDGKFSPCRNHTFPPLHACRPLYRTGVKYQRARCETLPPPCDGFVVSTTSTHLWPWSRRSVFLKSSIG